MEKMYPSRRDAIELDILPALGVYADEYDVEAIADEVLTWHQGDDFTRPGFSVAQDEEFWAAVDRHENRP